MNSGPPAYKIRTLLTWPSLISSQTWAFYSFHNLKNSFKSEFLVSIAPHSEVREDQVGQGCTKNPGYTLLLNTPSRSKLIPGSSFNAPSRASLPSSWIRVSMEVDECTLNRHHRYPPWQVTTVPALDSGGVKGPTGVVCAC